MLFDTGATNSCIALETVQALNKGRAVTPATIAVASAGGDCLDPVGLIYLKVQIGERKFNHVFIVCKRLMIPVIVGWDFSERYKVSMIWEKDNSCCLRIKGEKLVEAQMGRRKAAVNNIISIHMPYSSDNLIVSTRLELSPGQAGLILLRRDDGKCILEWFKNKNKHREQDDKNHWPIFRVKIPNVIREMFPHFNFITPTCIGDKNMKGLPIWVLNLSFETQILNAGIPIGEAIDTMYRAIQTKTPELGITENKIETKVCWGETLIKPPNNFIASFHVYSINGDSEEELNTDSHIKIDNNSDESGVTSINDAVIGNVLAQVKFKEEDIKDPIEPGEAIAKSAFVFPGNFEKAPKVKVPKAKVKPETELFLKELLQEFADIISQHSADIGETTLLTAKIATQEGAKPAAQRPYPLPLKHYDFLKKELDTLLRASIIRRSSSSYGAPVLVVPRKTPPGPDGKPASLQEQKRLVIDYRKLNAQLPEVDTVQTKSKGALSITETPKIEELMALVKGATIFSSIDFRAGYHHIKLDEESIPKSAISTPFGRYEWIRLPMGLSQGPAIFSAAMLKLFWDLLNKSVVFYLDDVLIFSKSEEEHKIHLREVLTRIREAGFKIKVSKCQFMCSCLFFLGHFLSGQDLRPMPEKVAAINNIMPPKDVPAVRALLGLANFYRKYIPRFAMIVAPINNLLKKNVTFEWSENCQSSLDLIKKILTTEPVLALPDKNKPYILYTDASNTAWSGILMQKFKALEDEEGEEEKPISFQSGTFTGAQLNWSALTKESYAIYNSFKKLSYFVADSEVHIFSDHKPLEKFITGMTKNSKVNNWGAEITAISTNVKFSHLSGRLNKQADSLSRLDYVQPIERLKELNLYPEKCADKVDQDWNQFGGTVFDDEPDVIVNQITVLEGVNNFKSLLDATSDKKFYEIKVSTNKLIRLQEIHNQRELKLAQIALENPVPPQLIINAPDESSDSNDTDCESNDSGIDPTKTESEQNKNAMSTSSKKSENRDDPEKDNSNNDSGIQTTQNKSKKKEKQSGPTSGNSPSKAIFFKDERGILCRKVSDNGNWFNAVVVPKPLQTPVLKDLHTHLCHAGSNKLYLYAHKYVYWQNLRKMCTTFVRKCLTCQMVTARAPKYVQKHSMVPQMPWDHVALDLMGPYPETEDGNKYILTNTCLLTNFLVLVPLPNKETNTVITAFVEKAVMIFGTPRVILTDNGTEFVSKITAKVAEYLGITHLKTSPYHPQGNSVSERQHSYIKATISKLISITQFPFDQLLNLISYSYNILPHVSHAESPSFLMFGRDFYIPSLHNMLQPALRYLGNEKGLTQLDAVKVALTAACSRLKAVRDKPAKKHQLENHDFKIGDLVLLKNHKKENPFSSKFLPNFRVVKLRTDRQLELSDTTGKTRRANITDVVKMLPGEIESTMVPDISLFGRVHKYVNDPRLFEGLDLRVPLNSKNAGTDKEPTKAQDPPQPTHRYDLRPRSK